MKFEELTAKDLMSVNLETCSPDQSVMEALKRMHELRIHCLLVPAADPGRSMGIVSAKDIVQLLGDAKPEILDELVVGEIMTSPVVSLPDYLHVADCINLMRMTGVRTAPIMRGRELVGLLSFSDVLRWIANNT
jgi:CBS domain-containing protein